ncbi:MAG: hypothetical protein COA83_11460 [Methylophaga sp.]|nr:MAG: hypothetical protein COA83_11460 [Methylophaga sp.]
MIMGIQGLKSADTRSTRPSFKMTLDNCLNGFDTLAEIAQRLNMSVSTLQRQFKRCYGMNISIYIKQRRMDTAKNRYYLMS